MADLQEDYREAAVAFGDALVSLTSAASRVT
jgi:hypothetical protein